MPKTDKRIKKTQSRIKLGAKTPIIPKKADDKFKLKNDNNEINIDNGDNNNLNSYRNFDTNYLLKSKSQEENIKLVSEELENIKVNTNNIMEKYNNLRIKSEESISHEMKNLLQIENDCLLNYDSDPLFDDDNNNNQDTFEKNNNTNILNKSITFSNKSNKDKEKKNFEPGEIISDDEKRKSEKNEENDIEDDAFGTIQKKEQKKKKKN